ncbi:MAG: GAF domain-containing protein, partial [Candidatus Rokubacteria bacterium]|nr:GAF domain-containing protein [Candidatus Rokubacteria bacterium]
MPRLETSKSRHAEQTVIALSEMTLLLSQSLDPEVVGQRIVDNVLRLLPVSRALLYELDAESGAMTCMAVAGAGNPGRWLGKTLPSGFGLASLAITEGRPVASANPLRDPRIRLPEWAVEVLRDAGQPAVVALPLTVEDQPLGALTVDTPPRRMLRKREVRTASAFAAQAALVLDRVRRYSEARRAQREGEVFAELTRQINASLDLSVVLPRIADAARELCRADLARVALRETGTPGLLIRYWSGAVSPDHTVLVLEPGKGLGGQILLTGQPFRTDDYLSDPRFGQDYRDAARANRIIATLGVPVRIGERLEGLLFVDRQTPHPFTDRDQERLLRLADHAATAIANAQLYAAERERAARLHTLSRVTQLVSSSLDPQHVLDEISRAAAALTASPVVCVWIADPMTQMLEARALNDPALNDDKSLRERPVGIGLTGWVASHRQPLAIPDVFADGRLKTPAWWRAHDLKSFYGIPIVDDQQLVGVLTLAGREPLTLAPEDEDLLRTFVAQAAVAIRNARLYEESERRRREAELTTTALQESEARYRQLVEGSVQGVWIHTDFIIQFANSTAARILGVESSEALHGRDLRDFAAPHERSRLEAYKAARERGGEAPVRYEFEAVRADGTSIWLEIVATVITWNGEPAFLATILDVTEVRRLEDQLRQAQKMEAVGQLAGGVAHDFNNLLTVIRGRSDVLRRRLAPDSPSRLDVDFIRGAADRAAALTRQLLAFSRKQLLRPRVLDINTLVAGIVPMLQRLVGEHM